MSCASAIAETRRNTEKPVHTVLSVVLPLLRPAPMPAPRSYSPPPPPFSLLSFTHGSSRCYLLLLPPPLAFRCSVPNAPANMLFLGLPQRLAHLVPTTLSGLRRSVRLASPRHAALPIQNTVHEPVLRRVSSRAGKAVHIRCAVQAGPVPACPPGAHWPTQRHLAGPQYGLVHRALYGQGCMAGTGQPDRAPEA